MIIFLEIIMHLYKMNMMESISSTIRDREQVIGRIGIDNSCLSITLISQISCSDPLIVIIFTSIEHMGKLSHMGLVTTMILVSFTSTITSLNLDITTSLLVGTIPMEGV